MFDQFGRIGSLIIVGGIAIRVITNPTTAKTVAAAFHGVAEDITASFGK